MPDGILGDHLGQRRHVTLSESGVTAADQFDVGVFAHDSLPSCEHTEPTRRPTANVGRYASSVITVVSVKPLVGIWSLILLAASCSANSNEPTTSAIAPPPPSTTLAASSSTTQVLEAAPTTSTTLSPFARPDWLGTKILPLRPDGNGEVQPTPAELQDRTFETIDLLPPPTSDEFEWTLGPVPADVQARSSWTEECPVDIDDLAYITVAHFGFDGRFHTGEMMLNTAIAEEVVEVFRQLHAARFPIEQMRVIRLDEVDDPPTGDWNETTSFVCRPAVGSNSWSQHAYGLAVDINPFHNPYLKGDLVIPELASVYTDRTNVREGMIMPDDVVTQAFADVGLIWGGNWNTLKDWMHFSQSGG